MANKNTKQLYEGMYIISSVLSEDARNKALERITNGISSRNGQIIKIHEQGRKKFAYPINGRREGYYYIIYFEAPTDLIAELWHEYHLNEDLIRFLHLKVENVMETIEFKQLVQA